MKIWLEKPYRDLVSFLSESAYLWPVIGLRVLPGRMALQRAMNEPAHERVPRPPEHIHRRAGLLWEKRCKEKRVCAIDSTGFSIRRFVRWFDISRHGMRKKRKDFLKLHFIVDVRSLLLILSFIRNDLRRLCAHKSFLSRKICNLVARYGGEPYISIKKDDTRIRAQGSKAWREMMLVMYRRSKKLYKKRYHRRSLAERDSNLDGEEEVQPHPLLEEEERAEERAQIKGDHIQPVDNSQATGSIWIVCQSQFTR